VTPEEHRRRIDEILDRAFLEALDGLGPDELRARLRDARSEEDALSYIRRNLHGRLDLLRAELSARKGERGTNRGVDALAAVLTDRVGAPRGTRAGLGLRAAAVASRRRAEEVLSDDHLARLPDMSDQQIAEVAERVEELEGRLSQQRRRVHEVIDTLESELAGRYKSGLEPSLDRLQ